MLSVEKFKENVDLVEKGSLDELKLSLKNVTIDTREPHLNDRVVKVLFTTARWYGRLDVMKWLKKEFKLKEKFINKEFIDELSVIIDYDTIDWLYKHCNQLPPQDTVINCLINNKNYVGTAWIAENLSYLWNNPKTLHKIREECVNKEILEEIMDRWE